VFWDPRISLQPQRNESRDASCKEKTTNASRRSSLVGPEPQPGARTLPIQAPGLPSASAPGLLPGQERHAGEPTTCRPGVAAEKYCMYVHTYIRSNHRHRAHEVVLHPFTMPITWLQRMLSNLTSASRYLVGEHNDTTWGNYNHN
jgi:hypothetical protein